MVSRFLTHNTQLCFSHTCAAQSCVTQNTHHSPPPHCTHKIQSILHLKHTKGLLLPCMQTHVLPLPLHKHILVKLYSISSNWQDESWMDRILLLVLATVCIVTVSLECHFLKNQSDLPQRKHLLHWEKHTHTLSWVPQQNPSMCSLSLPQPATPPKPAHTGTCPTGTHFIPGGAASHTPALSLTWASRPNTLTGCNPKALKLSVASLKSMGLALRTHRLRQEQPPPLHTHFIMLSHPPPSALLSLAKA